MKTARIHVTLTRLPAIIVVVLLMISAQRSFAQAPTVTTGAATGIGSSGATLNGTVNANGESTTVFFEYGLSTEYGLTVPAVPNPVSGSIDTAVTGTLILLNPNTTYHYRVGGTNASGTTYGADMTFTTTPPAGSAPIVVTGPATGIGADFATLNGQVLTFNVSTTVLFQWGTDTNYGNTVTADQSPVTSNALFPVTATLTGLANNTTYHYRTVASNVNGTIYGSDMTFTIGTVGAAPTATTNAATGISAISATLNGTVNDNGSSTVVTFEYGLDTGYGNTILANPSPVSGSADTAVSITIYDFLPNTTYHYRLVAINAFGTTNGADMTFTTLPMAPVAITNGPTAVNSSGATLNGTVNANNASATVTFEYGIDTSYGTTVTADQSPVTGTDDTPVSKAVSGLFSGITYHYRVKAVNAGGTTYGPDMTFTPGVSAPSAVSNAATSIGATAATLNGTVNANNQNTIVTFEYGPDMSYGRTVIAYPGTVTGSSNTPVNAYVSDLSANTTYHYRVVAESNGGTTYGSDMTFTTLAAPTVKTNATTSVTTSGATLNGMVNANGVSTTVTFEYGTDTNYGTTVTADQSPVTGTTSTAVSKAITGLAINTTYHYRVVGQNAHGTSYGADMTFVTSAPGAPIITTGAASRILQDGATLNGTVNANNADTTVTFEYGLDTGYGTTVTAGINPVTGSADTSVSAVVSSLTVNTLYHYRVVGQNTFGTTNGADMTFITTTAPVALTGAATNIGATSVTLNGTANANYDNSTVTGFEYDSSPPAPWYNFSTNGEPATVAGNSDVLVSKILTGLTPNTTYYYRFYTGNSLSQYTYGEEMTFTTLPADVAPAAVTDPATAVGPSTATLNGRVNANNTTTEVTFEYGLDTNYGKTAIAGQSPVTGGTITAVSSILNDLAPNTTYHYRVVAQNTGNIVYGADMTFTTGVLPPTADTNSATGVSPDSATLNGTVNAYNDSTIVTFEYGLTPSYGSTVTADQSPVTGNSSTAVSKLISGLTDNTTYHYRVVAQNSAGTTYGSDMTFFTEVVIVGAAPPSVFTDAATNIGSTSATLNGTVNANNSSTTVTFEYGTTVEYDRVVTADQSPVTGSSDTAVSSTLTNLLPNTTYHFRAKGVSADGMGNGADTIFTTGGLLADLSVTKTDGVAEVIPGQSLTYTIVATNNGPGNATSTSLIDNFPASLSCFWTSVTTGGATENTGSGAGDLAETLNMPAGSSVTYTVTCAVSSSVTGTLVNTATISSPVADPVPSNNSATDTDTVAPRADLSILKTDGVTSATVGQSLAYTIIAANNGPDAATSVSLADIIPSALTCSWTSVAGGGATGNTPSGSGNITETLNMPTGSSVTYTADCTIDPSATGTLVNTASIFSSVADPVPGNNSAIDIDTLVPKFPWWTFWHTVMKAAREKSMKQ